MRKTPRVPSDMRMSRAKLPRTASQRCVSARSMKILFNLCNECHNTACKKNENQPSNSVDQNGFRFFLRLIIAETEDRKEAGRDDGNRCSGSCVDEHLFENARDNFTRLFFCHALNLRPFLHTGVQTAGLKNCGGVCKRCKKDRAEENPEKKYVFHMEIL